VRHLRNSQDMITFDGLRRIGELPRRSNVSLRASQRADSQVRQSTRNGSSTDPGGGRGWPTHARSPPRRRSDKGCAGRERAEHASNIPSGPTTRDNTASVDLWCYYKRRNVRRRGCASQSRSKQHYPSRGRTTRCLGLSTSTPGRARMFLLANGCLAVMLAARARWGFPERRSKDGGALNAVAILRLDALGDLLRLLGVPRPRLRQLAIFSVRALGCR
jgi:hypothetical protein